MSETHFNSPSSFTSSLIDHILHPDILHSQQKRKKKLQLITCCVCKGLIFILKTFAVPFVKAHWSLSPSPPLLSSLAALYFQNPSVSFFFLLFLLWFKLSSVFCPFITTPHSLAYYTSFLHHSLTSSAFFFLPSFLFSPPATNDSSLHA